MIEIVFSLHSINQLIIKYPVFIEFLFSRCSFQVYFNIKLVIHVLLVNSMNPKCIRETP